MLIIKVFVNDKEIDDIRVQNMGRENEDGETVYEIKRPRMPESWAQVSHLRAMGYKPLLQDVLGRMIVADRLIFVEDGEEFRYNFAEDDLY